MSDKKVNEIEGPCCKEASAILNVSQGFPSYTPSSTEFKSSGRSSKIPRFVQQELWQGTNYQQFEQFRLNRGCN